MDTEYYRHHREEFAALLEAIQVASNEGLSVKEQAQRFGVSVFRMHCLRSAARRRGYVLPKLETDHTGRSRPESKKWAELEAKTERCRCGLLLPCESCLPTIEGVASSRRGPGATYPEGAP